MDTLQFWKSWPQVYQRIGFVIGGAFVFSLLFLWYSYFIAPSPALQWQHIQEQELEEIPVYTFQQGLLELTISGDNYLIFERLLGDTLKPNLPASYFFLAFLLISMIVLLSIITALGRFWYLIGMGLFILFIVGFRLEIVEVFGLKNKVFTIITLISYLIPSAYFQFFNTTFTFKKRLITFSLITLLLGIVLVSFTRVPYPLLHLSVTGITAGIVISIVFILMVAHEILASFVYIASVASKQGKSLNHFLIISSIYMINLALAYAHRIGMIDWNFMYLNLYLLITISGILGVWGFRMRQPQYEGILQADPFGVYLFLCLGTICFGTIGYFIGTANDPALVTLNDAIIYGHIGFGIIFLTYVISNFIGMMANNLPVYKVIYKPNNMPYFTFRFGGIIATLAFVFYNTWQVPVQNAFAGYYNAGGDLYQTMGDQRFAEAFYHQASIYGFLNHHSNYAIANIEGRNYNSIKERNFYNRASDRRPTEYSYLNLSQTYQRDQQWLDALLTLNTAIKKFPDSSPIRNTLGLVYSKLNVIDSALYFLQESMNTSITKNAAETNFIGVASKSNLSVKADSLLTLIESDNAGTKSNALAFANKQGTKIETQVTLPKDSTLNLFSASLINNYILNHLGELDSAFLSKTIHLAHHPRNIDYKEALLFASSLGLYADGQIGAAFSLLEEVAIFSNEPGRYNNILALWSLEQQDISEAITFTDFALQQSNEDALLTSALARSLSGQINYALIQWDSLKRHGDSTLHSFIESNINALAIQSNLASRLSDTEKYLFTQYRIDPLDTVQLNSLLAQIENEELRARAILGISQKLFELDEANTSIQVFQKIKGLKLSDRNLFNHINHFELDLIAKKGNLSVLSSQINEQQITFTPQWKNQQIYFKALLSELSGDSAQAKRNYEWLAKSNPFDEEAIIAASNFIAKTKGKLEAYAILTDALYMNPYSPKLLKAYSLAAAELGFDEYATSALERLKPLITARQLTSFLNTNQQAFAKVLQ